MPTAGARINKETLQQLQAIARNRGITVSVVIKEAIELYLQKHPQKPDGKDRPLSAKELAIVKRLAESLDGDQAERTETDAHETTVQEPESPQGSVSVRTPVQNDLAKGIAIVDTIMQLFGQKGGRG